MLDTKAGKIPQSDMGQQPAAVDRPGDIAPVIQRDRASRLPWFDELHRLAQPTAGEVAGKAQQYASIVSRQHPDHDTDRWEPPS